MASTAPIISLAAGLQRFTLFTSLPFELRFTIWRLSLSPRIVEILTSEYCTTGFYSQSALPTALHVCRESRQAVEALYPHCFGSFLQPERVRFNFDLDILYLDISQEEDGLYRLFGILKEAELARLKYVAIDEGYLGDGPTDFHLTIAGLKNALRAMTNLKEMIVVRDTTMDEPNIYFASKVQMKFYAELKLGQAEEGWPVSVGELPNVQEYAGWKASQNVLMTAVYGWRAKAIIASCLPSMFCPKSFFAMDADLVNKIAAETEEKRLHKQEITHKLSALETGNSLCKQYALRVTSALPVPKRIRSSSFVSSIGSNASVNLPEETPTGEESDFSGSVHSIRRG